MLHHPHKLTREDVYARGYAYMYLTRVLEEQLVALFRKGLVKGTVTISAGNEATSVGMTMPLRPGIDVVSLLQRDFGSHLVMGSLPYSMVCQYMANTESPTHGYEGNVHHGDAAARRFPMISHLGSMLAPVVGAVWAARRNGEDALGLGAIGDGGTSTGDFHEALNLASVRRVPVLFMIENNHYAFSTPTRLQYNCPRLSDRAAAYGIEGTTIDGTDVWEVYNAVYDALETMQRTGMPRIIESMSLRLMGHAVYDNADYVSKDERAEWMKREPLMRARKALSEVCGMQEQQIRDMESQTAATAEEAVDRALRAGRPVPGQRQMAVHAVALSTTVAPCKVTGVRNLTSAVNHALAYILEHDQRAFMLGQDIGPYGSAFKTSKGLYDRFGAQRVLDTPISESGTVGFALGASQTGARPIVEFQFADFSTEAVTQLGLNCGTWLYRSGIPAPIVFRLPCGGGITLGAFHSGEFEGLWSRFPGVKLLYPFTPQETFEALVAAFHDPNPCIVFEHKLLYGSQPGDIDFDGSLDNIMRLRCYREGSDLTVVAWGAMLRHAQTAATASGYSAEIWNPFILQPLAMEPLIRSVAKTGRLLVVQESGETAGLGDRFVSILARECFSKLKAAPRIVAAPDVPVPFAPELEQAYLPGHDSILRAIRHLMGDAL